MQTDGTVRANYLDWTSLVLVIVGAINWGLVGLGQLAGANWNVVNLIFGSLPGIESAIYLVVGLAGLYELYFAYQLFGAQRAAPRTRRGQSEP